MRSVRQPPRHRPTALATAALLGAGALLAVAVAGSAVASLPETVVLPPSGTVQLHGKGNGHGHGMSQYGAQGAAIKGLTTRQILAFYYPGTTLTTLPASTIRVKLSNAGSFTTAATNTTGLAVTGVTGPLPTAGYRFYRLVPSGAGLGLQRMSTAVGAPWTWVNKTLPSRADFTGSKGWVQIWLSSATSTIYRGTVGALRSGSGEITINRVSLDGYAEGVVPREMPASWRPAAVGAQAIAARSYGRQAVESRTGVSYDICDSTSCQVYGGARHYTSMGSLLYADDPAALVGNENQVLTYSGATIFAQYSASNGGATVAASQPYLVGKLDPYDAAASGDPYLNWSRAVGVTYLASYYGLKRVTSIQITRRDGYGAWGGRVVSAYVNGLTSYGASRHLATTGLALSWAMGLPTSLFHFDLTK